MLTRKGTSICKKPVRKSCLFVALCAPFVLIPLLSKEESLPDVTLPKPSIPDEGEWESANKASALSISAQEGFPAEHDGEVRAVQHSRQSTVKEKGVDLDSVKRAATAPGLKSPLEVYFLIGIPSVARRGDPLYLRETLVTLSTYVYTDGAHERSQVHIQKQAALCASLHIFVDIVVWKSHPREQHNVWDLMRYVKHQSHR